MIELKRHGSYLEVDKDGFVLPVDQNIEIQTKWKPIISDVIEFYKDHLDGIISIFIRGSVAKGQAVEGVSDLDSFCIVENGTKLFRDIPKIKEKFVEELQIKYPFCTHAEISSTQYLHINKEVSERKRSIISELIKTQSVCVYGKDLSKDIKPFRVYEMIGHALFIEGELDKLPGYFLEDEGNPEELKETCIWISRRLVRSGFDLVMEKENKFTRDLYLCFESFSKYYPNMENQMKEILNLSLNPISDVDKINIYLSNICPWLISEINNKLK